VTGLRVLLVVLLSSVAMSALAQEPLRGVALVIGETDYDGLPDLGNPERDARAMDELLGDLGFDVSRVLDGDADKLRNRIEEFVEDAADADVALVYYSGHGVELGGQNYLVPTDTDLSTPASAGKSLVPVAALLDELARTVPVTIVLLDACRTDAFPAGQMFELPGGAQVAVEGPGLEAVKGPTPVGRPDVAADSLGMVIGFAASPGQPALDGDPGGNSPYAAALLKHFAAGGYSLADLMTMVSEEVYLKTRAQQLPWVNSSLRRVLQFGAPTEETSGDDAEIRDGRRQLLLTIASAPEATRRYVEAVAKTEGVPLDALYGMLKVLDVDTSGGEQEIENQLREGAAKLKEFLAAQPGGAKTDVELVRLAGLADKAQAEGAIDLSLKFRQAASARADELDANVDATEANLKADRLQIGSTYADHARTAVLNFDFAVAAQMWGKAFDQVERWDEALALGYRRQQANALADHGLYRGKNDALTQAIALYEEISGPAESTDQWGPIRNDLGNALEELGERQSDRDMLERAVAAYEDALTRTPREKYALEWARTQSNIGVALMNLGQRSQGTELLERSAEAFGTSLEELTRERSPIEWAKTTSNFGNVMQMLADRNGDEGLYYEAADAHAAALEVLARDTMPLDWATVEANLGNALARIADQQSTPEGYDAAIDAFRLSLEDRPREKVPLDWAVTQDALGSVLASRAMRSGRVSDFDSAVAAFKAALEERTIERSPLDFGYTTANLALALKKRGELLDGAEDFDDAIAQYRAALTVFTFDNAPMMWGQTQANLGIVLLARADRSGERQDLVEARAAYAAALEVYSRVSADTAAYLEDRIALIDERLG
jgi:uncharacterized caspase-like protein